MSRYRFIQAEKATYPVALLCRVLQVARSAYYAWARRGVSARAQASAANAASTWPIASVSTTGRSHQSVRPLGGWAKP